MSRRRRPLDIVEIQQQRQRAMVPYIDLEALRRLTLDQEDLERRMRKVIEYCTTVKDDIAELSFLENENDIDLKRKIMEHGPLHRRARREEPGISERDLISIDPKLRWHQDDLWNVANKLSNARRECVAILTLMKRIFDNPVYIPPTEPNEFDPIFRAQRALDILADTFNSFEGNKNLRYLLMYHVFSLPPF